MPPRGPALVPATPMQVGLLYESTLSGKPSANLEQVVVEMDKATPEALQAAWVAVAQRHDALRMALQADASGGFVIVPHDRAQVQLCTQDWSDVPAQMQEERLAAWLAQDRAAGADPRSYPNWRVTVIDTGAGRAVMVWTIHHALIDGTSLAVVLEDLFDHLQGAETHGAGFAEYCDFARRLPQGDKAAAQAFFRDMLADQAGAAPLVPPGAAPGTGAQALVRGLGAQHSAALRAAVAGMGATPLNAVQAAWGLVLARWTGQAECCFGLVDSGRSGADHRFDRTVGCLINTLPLRIGFAPDQTLGPLLADLRQTTRAMRAHGHASVGEIRRWVGATGQAALFDTLVMVARGTLEAQLARAGKGWDTRRVRLIEEGTAAATLAVYDDADMLVMLEHDPARLPPDQAARLLDQVLRLLHAMSCAVPDTPLGALDMLDPGETSDLLALAQPEVAAAPSCPCIATRFEAVANRQPQALALVDAGSGDSLTYRKLDQRANALARRLVATGLAEGDIIALLVPRGPDFVTALLAVLKVGAVALLLDPDQPRAFLAGLVVRAGAKAVIAPEDREPLAPGLPLIAPDLSQDETPPPRPAPLAGRAAYVIHTSGSTGPPKGVLGLCGALSAHADAVAQAYALVPQDRVLQFAGLAFDVTLEEIIPTLLAGAQIVLRDEGAVASVPALLDLLRRQRITVLNLPASFWHVMVEEMARRSLALPPSVRLLVTGSERINPVALAQWQRLAPGLGFINAYGPTEATVTCTAYHHDSGKTHPTPGDVPIGRPLGHALVRLRAFDGSLAPRGGIGLLWVGGAAVAGGYLGQPDQTAASFGADPWHAGARLYCTGDQARWRDDGQLMFLGRRDRQVKLRGHRIDLHQVETVLAALPQVQQAHVALDGDAGSPGARLLAWLVCETGPDAVDLSQVRRAAARSLPAYMLPFLIGVDRLPVGPNGKINTKALPRTMTAGDSGTEAGAQVLSDPLTTTIAECFKQVLALDSVSPDASFHDLGGDSLLSLRLVSLIEAETGETLRATDLHAHASPAALAQMLRSGTRGPRHIIPIQPAGPKVPFFAVHVLGRNEELFRPLSAALGPDYPVFGLSVGVPRDLAEIDVKRSARLYFEDIQRHHPTGPLALGAVSMAAYFAFELAQLLRVAGRDVRLLAVLDAMGPDGRPSVAGRAKLRAHLGQIRKRGLAHLGRIAHHRIEQVKVALEGKRSRPEDITGYNLVVANVRAVERYAPQPYGGRLTIFRADASFWDSPEAIASGLGWASVARGGFDLHDLPGTHLSLLQPQNVEALAAHLRRLLG